MSSSEEMKQYTERFIVFEGGEGSGKTRHSKAAARRLQEEGHEVLWTSEPGSAESEVCTAIRQTILHDATVPRSELLLFLANRAQHIEEVVKPALEAGKIVICDRFSGSTMAYQLGARQLPQPDFIKQMDAYARSNMWPQSIFFLDVPVEEGLSRRMGDGSKEVNRLDKEKVEFHEAVRQHFLQQAEEGEEWQVISTLGSKEENEEKIYQAVKNALGL